MEIRASGDRLGDSRQTLYRVRGGVIRAARERINNRHSAGRRGYQLKGAVVVGAGRGRSVCGVAGGYGAARLSDKDAVRPSEGVVKNDVGFALARGR